MNIIAFPFAGGNKYSYSFLSRLFDDQITMNVFEYPGRGMRMDEPFLESIDEIVEDLFPKVTQLIDDNNHYIIYGHSMGALIAFLICHKIKEEKMKMPFKLIISGRKAPSVKENVKIWDYPSEEFWNEVIAFGGVPEEIEMDSSIKNIFEPVLRADFKAIEAYKYKKQPLLDIPIEVLYGDEELERENDFLDWNLETSGDVRFYKFRGNHFFIHNYAQDIANHFI